MDHAIEIVLFIILYFLIILFAIYLRQRRINFLKTSELYWKSFLFKNDRRNRKKYLNFCLEMMKEPYIFLCYYEKGEGNTQKYIMEEGDKIISPLVHCDGEGEEYLALFTDLKKLQPFLESKFLESEEVLPIPLYFDNLFKVFNEDNIEGVQINPTTDFCIFDKATCKDLIMCIQALKKEMAKKRFGIEVKK